MTQSSSLLKRRSGVIVKKEEERQEQLILADEYVREGYDLLWNKNDCEGATKLLLEAFKIQRENLGKHEKDGESKHSISSFVLRILTKFILPRSWLDMLVPWHCILAKQRLQESTEVPSRGKTYLLQECFEEGY